LSFGIVATNRVGIAVDLDIGRWWFNQLNGVWLSVSNTAQTGTNGDPSSSAGLLMLPSTAAAGVVPAVTSSHALNVTIHGSATQLYRPAGFQPWDYKELPPSSLLNESYFGLLEIARYVVGLNPDSIDAGALGQFNAAVVAYMQAGGSEEVVSEFAGTILTTFPGIVSAEAVGDILFIKRTKDGIASTTVYTSPDVSIVYRAESR
jgi:hypothetical protein